MEAANMEVLEVSIPKYLADFARDLARETHKSKDEVIARCLAEKHKERSMRKYYKEMAGEHRAFGDTVPHIIPTLTENWDK